METSEKTAAGKAPERSGFVPSIIRPLELSRRPDSAPARLPEGPLARGPRPCPGQTATARGPDIVAIDRQRVTEAAAWISAKVAATLRSGAEDVGEYVLDTFFGGDPQLAKSKNPSKNLSFRALAEKCGTPELPVSKTWLNNAVGVALMLRRLPESAMAFRELAPSYRDLLLPLREPAKVERVARQAVAKDLSYRALRQAVAEERAQIPKADTRGRPRTPIVVKTLDRVLKLLGSGGVGAFSRSEIKALDGQQKHTAKARAEDLIGKLRQLISRLG